jgi:hypothetical protein
MARCEMSLNVPMWRDVGEGCAMSSLGSTGGSTGLRQRIEELDPSLYSPLIDS